MRSFRTTNQSSCSPCQIDTINEDGHTGFSLVTCSAFENLTFVVAHLLQGSFLPQVEVAGPVLLPQIRPVSIGVAVNVTPLVGCV